MGNGKNRMRNDILFLFPGATPDKPFANLPNVWKRVKAQSKLLPPNFTLHGLRHAFASIADDLGYAEPTIKAMLGHGKTGTTSGYIHRLDVALIAAADRVSTHISWQLNAINCETES